MAKFNQNSKTANYDTFQKFGKCVNSLPVSSAVLFFMKAATAKDVPPPGARDPRQLYVWWCRESAWTVPYPTVPYPNLINLYAVRGEHEQGGFFLISINLGLGLELS